MKYLKIKYQFALYTIITCILFDILIFGLEGCYPKPMKLDKYKFIDQFALVIWYLSSM